jgi:uncharacterized protein YgiM (DUF1202 family)
MFRFLIATGASLAVLIGGVSIPQASVNAAPLVRVVGYQTNGTAYVRLSDPSSSLTVRVGPAKKDKAIGALYYGEAVTLLRVSTDSQWFLVSSYSGKYGWVNAAYLQFPDYDH